MNRLLLAGLLAGLSSPLAATPSYAAGETCQGQPATIVGTPGASLTGTPGADVVVTNGARSINAGAGDDVICTTGTVGTDGFNYAVAVLAGEGNDVVDRRGESDPLAAGNTNLGSGANTFYGAAARDLVSTAAGVPDTIATGDGPDTVFANYAGFTTAEADSVDLGPGDDLVTFLGGLSPGLALTGGDGTDTLWVEDAPPGAWTIDAAAGQIRGAATVYQSFAGFDAYRTYNAGPLTFVGSDRDESLYSPTATLRSVSMGGGDDELTVPIGRGHGRVRFDGGAGRDLIAVHGSKRDSFVLDLTAPRLRIEGDVRGRVPGFEDATVVGGDIELTGTSGPNDLVWSGCLGGEVHAGGGADTVTLQTVDPEDYRCPGRSQPRLRAFGGGGPDLLVGGPSRDLLVGGAGQDEARGGKGRDTCDAETTRSC